MTSDAERIAIVETEIKHLSEQSDKFEKKLDALDKKLDSVIETLAAAGGGWKVVLGVAGFVAFATTLLTKLLPMPWPK